MANKFLIIAFLLFSRLLCAETQATKQVFVDDETFLNMIERQTFNYFIECSHPETGLVLDRANNFKNPDFKEWPASIAGVGFGLSCLAVGAERGWISRADAEQRVITTLKFFLEKMARKNGFFCHFIDARNGNRVWNSEFSSIDTALFIAGALHAAEYFRKPRIQILANRLYYRVNWKWMMNGRKHLSMGWNPETGFIDHYWQHYNESMILYILAMGSPTFPVSPEAWKELKRPISRYGEYEAILCPPLFTHQYSHIWIDFRNKSDGYCDYFHNSVQATLANRAFCINSASVFKTFSEDCWGLTACLGPDGYMAYGGPPGNSFCDGTVAPTAAASSIVFTPEYSIKFMRNIYTRYYKELWGRYGFSDAFNFDRNYFCREAFAINQGPMMLMIENFRTNGIWNTFMKIPAIQNGMNLAGFGKQPHIVLNRDLLQSVPSRAYFLDKKPITVAKRIPETVLFGKIGFDDGIWTSGNSPLILAEEHYQSGDRPAKNYSVETHALNQNSFLFLKVKVTDSQICLRFPDKDLFKGDCIEFYLDPGNDNLRWNDEGDFQIIVSPDKANKALRVKEFFHGEKLNGFIKGKFRKNADGYEFMLRFPKARFKMVHSEIGFSIGANNVDLDTPSETKLISFFAEPGIHLGVLKLQ